MYRLLSTSHRRLVNAVCLYSLLGLLDGLMLAYVIVIMVMRCSQPALASVARSVTSSMNMRRRNGWVDRPQPIKQAQLRRSPHGAPRIASSWEVSWRASPNMATFVSDIRPTSNCSSHINRISWSHIRCRSRAFADDLRLATHANYARHWMTELTIYGLPTFAGVSI